MNAPKHTPGPWTEDDGFIHAAALPSCFEYVAWTGPYTGEESDEAHEQMEANARLIAAAPDLLAALIGLTFGAESMDVQIEGEWGSCRSLEQIEADGDMREDILEARAAIAKATGAA